MDQIYCRGYSYFIITILNCGTISYIYLRDHKKIGLTPKPTIKREKQQLILVRIQIF